MSRRVGQCRSLQGDSYIGLAVHQRVGQCRNLHGDSRVLLCFTMLCLAAHEVIVCPVLAGRG